MEWSGETDWKTVCDPVFSFCHEAMHYAALICDKKVLLSQLAIQVKHFLLYA